MQPDNNNDEPTKQTEAVKVDEILPVSKMHPEKQLATFKEWHRTGVSHSRKWRAQAKADFDFKAGHGQWDKKERDFLTSEKGGIREPVTFNRTLTVIKAVVGSEINSRLQITFLPRTVDAGPVQKAEALDGASKWMDDDADAASSQTRAFQDTAVCGMGFVESAMSTDEDPDGSYIEPRIFPLEMNWDPDTREDNLKDSRWREHVRANIKLEDARKMFPKVLEEDLHAGWAHFEGLDTAEAKPVEERRQREENTTGDETKNAKVTIARFQWWEFEDFWRIVDPILSGPIMAAAPEKAPVYIEQLKQSGIDVDGTGPTIRVPGDLFKNYEEMMAALGVDMATVKKVKQARKVYKQAFVGKTVLSVEPCPNPKGFSFHCMTGEPDDNAGTWFGLVTVIRDPQRWANKWATQIIAILNTTAKGGIIAEKDAFDDPNEAEKNYAAPDAITWAADGAIAKGKVMAKPGAGNINGLDAMLQLALEEIRQVSGVNMEILGLRDANQPGVLEAQRKQAAMTILATLFDSLRRMRRFIGINRLHYIQNFLADGRLIPIIGEDGAKRYIALKKQSVAGDYDIVVEDAPTSPNQKQETWAIIMQMLPAIRDKLTPQMWLLLLEYSPLPSKLVEAFKKMLEEPDPKAEQRADIADATALAEAEKTRATAAKDRAAANKTNLDAILELFGAAVTGANVAEAARLYQAIPGQSRLPAPASPDLAGGVPAGATVN